MDALRITEFEAPRPQGGELPGKDFFIAPLNPNYRAGFAGRAPGHDEEGYARWQKNPRKKNSMKKNPWIG